MQWRRLLERKGLDGINVTAQNGGGEIHMILLDTFRFLDWDNKQAFFKLLLNLEPFNLNRTIFCISSLLARRELT